MTCNDILEPEICMILLQNRTNFSFELCPAAILNGDFQNYRYIFSVYR